MKKRYIVGAVIFFVIGALLIADGIYVYSLMSSHMESPASRGDSIVLYATFGQAGFAILVGIFMLLRGKKKAKKEREEAANNRAEKQQAGEEASEEAVLGGSPEAAVAEATVSEDEGVAEHHRRAWRLPSERKKREKLPSEKWFAENGMPLKEIPIAKSTLRSFSAEEKAAFSLTTYAVLKKKLLIAIAEMLIAVGVIIFLFLKEPVTGAFATLAILFCGGFVVGKTGQLLEGFMMMKGPGRLGLNPFIQFLFELLRFIFTIFSVFASLMYAAFDMVHKEKAASLPRIAMPQGFGYDAILDYYSTYEAAVKGLDEGKLNAEKADYRKKQQALDDIQHAVDTSGLGMQDKAQLGAAIHERKEKNEQTYNDTFGPHQD